MSKNENIQNLQDRIIKEAINLLIKAFIIELYKDKYKLDIDKE